jgi:hypothetical protein
MTYIEKALTKPLSDLPPELAQFGDYNAAIVAWRFARRRRDQVPIERWFEEAKRCANGPALDAAGASDSDLSLTGVLDRLGITGKGLSYEKP